MTTDDAAHVIELAVVEKPFEITPPWLHSWQIASVILPTPMRKSMEWVFKLTKDSEASVQGIK
jgi:hypothetical protein